MHSLGERIALGLLVLLTIGALGAFRAINPKKIDNLRMRFPGQGKSPYWYIRLLGIVFFTLSLVWAVLAIFFAH